jgi:hypothetical protein
MLALGLHYQVDVLESLTLMRLHFELPVSVTTKAFQWERMRFADETGVIHSSRTSG